MRNSNLKATTLTERLEAEYISFYRGSGSQTYYVIDQQLRQVYEAHPTINADFNYSPVPDAELPNEVLQLVEEIRRMWLAA